MIEQRQEVGRRQQVQVASPGRLGALRSRTDQPAIGLGRVQGSE